MQQASDAFRGARMATLRQLEGLTQADLAGRLDVTQGFVSQVEKGLKPLPGDLANKAAREFDLPVEFFSVAPSLTDEGFATFRKSARATAKDENRVVANFGEAARLFQTVSERSGYRTADLAELRDLDIEVCARTVRSELHLAPDEPVLNATRATERLGVGVVHDLVDLPAESRDHAGVSRPNPFVQRPLVATVGQLPPAVMRMTVLHELAHIIYDGDRATAIRSTRSLEEKRAYKFAGAVLLPEPVVRDRVTGSLTLQGYLRIKADYGISASAIIVRAADLGVITPERKRTLLIQHSSNGWRHDEPVPVANETAVLLGQAASRTFGSDLRSIAHQTGIRESDIARWTGLVPPVEESAKVIDLAARRRMARD